MNTDKCFNTEEKKFPYSSGMILNRQSPINIDTSKIVKSEILKNNPLVIKYEKSDFKVLNNGHTAMFYVKDSFKDTNSIYGGPITSNHIYKLFQFHFHWSLINDNGTEHSIDGIKFASELHLVHWNSTLYTRPEEAVKYESGLAVIAIFLIYTSDSIKILKPITECIRNIQYKGDVYHLDNFDLKSLLVQNVENYCSYLGSLTTTPFTSNVDWIVFLDHIKIDEELLESLRSMSSTKKSNETEFCDKAHENIIIKDNTREIFEIFERVISTPKN